MSSIQTQFLNIKAHHSQYPAIDPKTTLKGSASGKIIFVAGASRGIGQATAVAFAQAGARAIYITARSEKALEETKARVSKANPETGCEYMVCDVTDEEQVKADWAKGRYLSCNWDVDEFTQLKDQIIQDDLLVNRLRTKA